MNREHEHSIAQIEDTRAVSSMKESLQSKRRRGLIALVGGPVLATFLLAAAACDAQDSSPIPTANVDPTPTSVLEPHNVPWLRIEDKDANGDGQNDVRDLRELNGQEWLPGLNFNVDFKIDEDDETLIDDRIEAGAGSIQPWDINDDRQVDDKDAAIVRKHIGESVPSDPDSNIRNDEALQSSWSPNQMLIRVGADFKDKEIKSLLEKYSLSEVDENGNLTNVDKHILLGDLGINLTVEIPEGTLANIGLSKLLEEVARDSEVIATERVNTFRW